MYLVDGNNVMGQRVGWHRDKAGAQRRLIEDLCRFSRQEGSLVQVAFDGPPLPDTEDGAPLDGVQVYFARRGSDADERIVELAAGAGDADEVIAVTSDRALRERLDRLGIETMRSGHFRKLLEQTQ